MVVRLFVRGVGVKACCADGEGEREGGRMQGTDPITLTPDASHLALVRFAAQPRTRRGRG